MKGKKLTYLLILSVMGVWGVIFYRIYDAAQTEETFIPQASAVKASYESLEDYRLKDTFTLVLNYRDPFLGGQMKPETAEPPVTAGASATTWPVEPLPAEPVIDWSFIRYTGYIMNPSTKRVVAIMSVNGKEYMLGEGQSADGVTLIRSFRDSVKVSFKDKTKHIKVQ